METRSLMIAHEMRIFLLFFSQCPIIPYVRTHSHSHSHNQKTRHSFRLFSFLLLWLYSPSSLITSTHLIVKCQYRVSRTLPLSYYDVALMCNAMQCDASKCDRKIKLYLQYNSDKQYTHGQCRFKSAFVFNDKSDSSDIFDNDSVHRRSSAWLQSSILT